MISVKLFCCFLVISLVEGKISGNYHIPSPLIKASENDTSSPIWATITQYVDHFNPTDERTWEMRYLQNAECFKTGGPIVIYLGGEWTIRNTSLKRGATYDIACENNGYMFHTEHRYYGESYPTKDFSTANLKYLSSDQALADLAYFVQYVKANNPQLANAKVVVIGASYSATLATWARIKYPHLFDIAYSSSGPVRDEVDFKEYWEGVAAIINSVSKTCFGTIKSAFSQMETMLATADGIKNLSTIFNTCETIKTVEPERSYFFNAVAFPFATLVQYAAKGDVEQTCGIIANHSGSDVAKLANYVKSTNDPACMESYDQFVKRVGSADLTTTTTTDRQWNYQLCSDIGWLQNTNANDTLFGNTFPIEIAYRLCEDLFGTNFDEEMVKKAVLRTNLFYGSDTPVITRLITVQGTVDPWHYVGILKDLNSLAITFVVNGTSHTADLQPISNNDSEEMRRVKLSVRETITKWLKEI